SWLGSRRPSRAPGPTALAISRPVTGLGDQLIAQLHMAELIVPALLPEHADLIGVLEELPHSHGQVAAESEVGSDQRQKKPGYRPKLVPLLHHRILDAIDGPTS